MSLSPRVQILRKRLGLEACDIEDVKCVTQVNEILDDKLQEIRDFIEQQKKYHSFKTYSYDKFDRILKEVGY